MDTKECLTSCSESGDHIYEYMNGCYTKCPDGTLLDGFNCFSNECEGKPDSATCKSGTPKGYYYDSTDKIYKKCYEKCNYCSGEGTATDNKCTECISGYRLLEDNNNIENCYENCNYYFYFDNSNNYHCTDSNACPAEYRKLIVDKGQCIYEEIITTALLKEVTTIITEALTVKSTENIPISTAMSSTAMISTAISSTPMISTAISSTPMISTAISSTSMSSSAISNTSPKAHDTIRESENAITSTEIITTSNEQTDTNVTENDFNLEEYGCIGNNPLTLTCSMEETRDNNEIYDILVNDILSTYDGDTGKSIVIEGHNNTIFQVTNTKNELDLLTSGNISDDYNLSICSGVNINIYVPLELSEETKNMADQIKELGYNMFDINDKFYQDICSPYKSTVDSDVLLSDRIDYIYNNEDSQCQGNCEFTNYALVSRYINCTCSAEVVSNVEGETEKIDKFEANSIY